MSRCVEIKSLNDHTISSEEDILRGSEGDLLDCDNLNWPATLFFFF
jgi:hypothetical protein